MTPIGVLLMAYGGPRSLEEVEPYLLDVRGFRPTARRLIDEVRERYRVIGGRSPILERTNDQAAALQRALDTCTTRDAFRVVVGMRHWHPFIAEALAELRREGISRAVGLVMTPHYSRMSIGAYYRKVEEAASPVEIARIERWHLLPGYLDALAARVQSGLERFPAERRRGVTVIFTAHSLPERILEWGDPYPRELRETVAALMRRLGEQPHEFAYQSAAITPDPWLGPDAGEVIGRLAQQGRSDVLIAPIGFTTEHVEILYDIDHQLRRQAAALDVRLERIEMLGAAEEMMIGLAELVEQAAGERGWIAGSATPG